MRNNRPEKNIGSIPEDDWNTDCGPGGNPVVCLGIAHHFVEVFGFGWSAARVSERRPWLLFDRKVDRTTEKYRRPVERILKDLLICFRRIKKPKCFWCLWQIEIPLQGAPWQGGY
jgi:hypothetical protein